MNLNFRKLKADELEARVAKVTEKGCSVLIYKNARVDMTILDETVGKLNWQRAHREEKGNLFCGIGIKDTDSGEWIWKWDCGAESYTEKEKGEASDSFKRAGFNWGIGRELYTCPFIWFKASEITLENKGGKLTTRDRFVVDAIEYENDKVSHLVVRNTKTKAVFTFDNPNGRPGKSPSESDTIADTPGAVRKLKSMITVLEEMGATAFMDELKQAYGITKVEDIKKIDYRQIVQLAQQKHNLLTGTNE